MGAFAKAVVAVCLVCGVGGLGGRALGEAGGLGAVGVEVSGDKPVGWRGDWTGRFVGATPPVAWSRRVKGVTSELKYQADKPGQGGQAVGKDARDLEYFTIKDWLVAGPFSVDDPKDMGKDLLGGEAAVEPAKGGKAGEGRGGAWRLVRADVDTQSRHECNGGTCGNSNVDFVAVFGKITGDGMGVKELKVEGDFSNKVAYAHTYIYSPAEARVNLQLPFEGVAGRFWLNGKGTDLEAKNRGRSFEVVLAKGWNRLLVKVGVVDGVNKGDRWASRWMVAGYVTPAAAVSYETQGISWMTKMTGRSVSQPIVVGERIFVGSGLSDLLCISKRDGKVLWIASNTPYEGLTAADGDLKEKTGPLAEKLRGMNVEVMAAINAAVSPVGLGSKEAAGLDQKLKAKDQAERALSDAFTAADKKKYIQMYLNEVSPSNGTACSDGKYVYWMVGGGQGWRKLAGYVVACFDLEGKRVWTRYLSDMGVMEHGSHSSPALVDGKLILGISQTLVALDAKTGAEVWRNSPKDWTNELYASSPVVTGVGGAKMIVGNRYIHRVSDGAVICCSNISGIGSSCATPVVEGGVLYNAGQQLQGDQRPPTFLAVKLPADAQARGEGAKAQTLWSGDNKDVSTLLRGANFMIASPLYAGGLVYTVDMSGGLVALDPAGKKCVYRQWLGGYNRFDRSLYGVCASPTLGGKYVYLIDDAGYVHIVEPGGTAYKEVGCNVLENIHTSGVGGNPCRQESFYTSPWFEGKMMYLRGEEYLYGIGGK